MDTTKTIRASEVLAIDPRNLPGVYAEEADGEAAWPAAAWRGVRDLATGHAPLVDEVVAVCPALWPGGRRVVAG